MRAARLARADRLAHDNYADENDEEQHAIRVKLLSLSKQLHAADDLSKTMQARDEISAAPTSSGGGSGVFMSKTMQARDHKSEQHEISAAPTSSGGGSGLSMSKVLPLTNAAARYVLKNRKKLSRPFNLACSASYTLSLILLFFFHFFSSFLFFIINFFVQGHVPR